MRRPAAALLAAALLAAWVLPAAAETLRWDMANEYPASSMQGEGDAVFAAELKERTAGRIALVGHFDATRGKSADIFRAVGAGTTDLGDVYAGALGGVEPVFLLSSLPFLAVTTEAAERLFETARAEYDRVLAEHGQKLLYASPWPPSGIWAKKAIVEVAALKGLRIRTYDATSTRVFAAVGAVPSQLSFADALPRLRAGEIEAVLSSGDGGAGARLWDFLDHFSAVDYAMPLSLVTINLKIWNGLSGELKRAVEAAAGAASERQWRVIHGRVEANYARMRENGVTIAETVSPQLAQAFSAAAASAIAEWEEKAGPAGREILAAYRK